MGYIHAKAKAIFKKQWEEKKALYIKYGMSDEQIQSLCELEREQFNSNRKFYENTVSLFDNEYNDSLSYVENFYSEKEGVEMIEDEKVYRRLRALPEIYLQAYRLYVLLGFFTACLCVAAKSGNCTASEQ